MAIKIVWLVNRCTGIKRIDWQSIVSRTASASGNVAGTAEQAVQVVLRHSTIIAAVLEQEAGQRRAHQLVLIPLGVRLQEALHAAEQGFGDFGFQADDLLALVGVTGLAAAPVVQRLALGLPRDEATFLPSSSKGLPLATKPLSHR